MTINLFLQLAGMFLIPLAIVIIPVLIGRRYGIYYSAKQSDIPRESIGSVVAAAFGLLAFMLAFTFQIATNRWDSRRALLLEEVTHIKTAYLRAGLIPEPYSSAARKNLVAYVDLRADFANDKMKLADARARSERILDSLWSYAETLATQDRSSEAYALYTVSINELVDIYDQRIIVSLMYRIPSVILLILSIMIVLAMFILGYQFGISGKGSTGLSHVLAMLFAVVMFLIFVLDRPEVGLMKLNHKPLFTLQQQLHEKDLKVGKRPVEHQHNITEVPVKEDHF